MTKAEAEFKLNTIRKQYMQVNLPTLIRYNYRDINDFCVSVKKERVCEIVELVHHGKTASEIGKQYSISSSRVHDILKYVYSNYEKYLDSIMRSDSEIEPDLIVNKTTNIEYLKLHNKEVMTFLQKYSILSERHISVIEELLNGKNLNEVAKMNNISVSRIKELLQKVYHSYVNNYANTDEFLIFPNRCANALKRHGFKTVEEVREYVRKGNSLTEIKGISSKSEKAILEKI